MTIYEILKDDHKLVKDILNKLEKTDEHSSSERLKLLNQLKEGLLPHARAEEIVLYESLKECGVKEADELGFEGYEEHAVADHLILELESTEANDKRWGALLSVLKENIEHHIKEEENNMFKKAQQAFDSNTAEVMGILFTEMKAQFLEGLKKGKELKQLPSHDFV